MGSHSSVRNAHRQLFIPGASVACKQDPIERRFPTSTVSCPWGTSKSTNRNFYATLDAAVSAFCCREECVLLDEWSEALFAKLN